MTLITDEFDTLTRYFYYENGTVFHKIDTGSKKQGEKANTTQVLLDGRIREVIFLGTLTLMAAKTAWILTGNTIPEGKRLRFKDKNPCNINIDNLYIKETCEYIPKHRVIKSYITPVGAIVTSYNPVTYPSLCSFSDADTEVTISEKKDYLLAAVYNKLLTTSSDYFKDRCNYSRDVRVLWENVNNVFLKFHVFTIVNNYISSCYYTISSEKLKTKLQSFLYDYIISHLSNEDNQRQFKRVVISKITELRKAGSK